MFDEREAAYLKEMEARLLEQSSKNMQMLLENSVDRKLDLLNEKIDLLADKVAPKSRVEALEDEVAFMKQVIRSMTMDIQELKKAE